MAIYVVRVGKFSGYYLYAAAGGGTYVPAANRYLAALTRVFRAAGGSGRTTYAGGGIRAGVAYGTGPGRGYATPNARTYGSRGLYVYRTAAAAARKAARIGGIVIGPYPSVAALPALIPGFIMGRNGPVKGPANLT